MELLNTGKQSIADLKHAASRLVGEDRPNYCQMEPVVTNGKALRETHRRPCSEDHLKGRTAPKRSKHVHGPFEVRSQGVSPEDPLGLISGGSKHKRDTLESENPNPQSIIEVEIPEVSGATPSISERQSYSNEFELQLHDDLDLGNTDSCVPMRPLETMRFELSSPYLGPEYCFQRNPTSFDIASQGLGSQFEKIPPVSCSELVTLPTKDEAESISNGVFRARGSPLSPV